MDPSELSVILEDAGVEVVRESHDEVYAHCPKPGNHPRGDRRASWSMNTETTAHFCFSCGYRGNLETLLQDLTGRTPQNIKDLLRSAKHKRRIEKEQAPKEAVAVEPEIFISEWQLKEYELVPLWACLERQLDPDLVDHYGVRWDGVNNYWIIPAHDIDGKLLGWQEKGRDHFNNVPSGMQKSKSLFGLKQFVGTTAILVESPLDVIRLASVGIDGGLASFGSWVSEEQFSMAMMVAETLILALDHDDAGRSSMMKIIADHGKRMRMRIVRYRKDDLKDVGEMKNSSIHRLIDGACDVHRGSHHVHR